MGIRRGLGLAALAVALGHGAIASAQEMPVPETPSEEVPVAKPSAVEPWDVGVTQEQKDKAAVFFDAAFDLAQHLRYADALAEYRKAFAHRDHPAIHYNMAVCLLNMEEPVKAHEHLTAAMRYPKALTKENERQAKTYLKVLDDQLANVHIVVKEEGARVTLDGEELFVGPGEVSRRLRAKQHQITVSKKGMYTVEENFTPSGGEVTPFDIAMLPVTQQFEMRRRWAQWKPWVVAGSGLGAAAIGGVFTLLAQNNADNYNNAIANDCPAPLGCGLNSDAAKRHAPLKSRSEWQDVVAVSLYVVGGAAVVSGLVGVFLNRPQAYEIDGRPGASEGDSGFALTPLLGPEGSGGMSSYTFHF